MSRELDLTQSKSRWTATVKLRRLLWAGFQPLFFLPPHRLLSPLRVLALRLFGAKIGPRVLIMGGVRIWMPWNLEIGELTAIGWNVEIYNFGRIRIGSSTVISQYTYLCSASHDHTHPHFPLIWKPIDIGSKCWIAAGAFIGPGVTIGEGSVIGARSVVTQPMPEWTVCAGNPCRPLKPRTLSALQEDPAP